MGPRMRSVWQGSIGFDDIGVPVRAYVAAGERRSGLVQVHTTDGGRVRYRRVCEADGAEVPRGEVGRGVLTGGGTSGEVAVLDDDDLAALDPPTARTMRIESFLRPADLDPVHVAGHYYLEPAPDDPGAVTPYVLLVEALRLAERVALVKVTMNRSERLGVLVPRDQLLVLRTLHWPAQVRTPDFPFLHDDVELRLSQVRAAATMIEELTGPYEPEAFSDDYAAALDRLVAAKVEGGDVLRPSAPAGDERVARLLRLLTEAAQSARRDVPAQRETEPEVAPARD
ncbi:Ku protein [Saccharomonospora piscinae]|nr:Ku protein [Saccharomonospora piscinae]TLW90912.1 Ku protein [Saccharomonospora piscinae]